MGIYKEFHEWCIFYKECSLFREEQFVCTHHSGSGQCGKYRELKRNKIEEKSLENKKKWNIYHFFITVLLIFMIFIFIVMSLIIKDILNLVEDYSRNFIDFIRNLFT